LSTRKVEKIGKVAGFGLNSRKSLRKAKPSFGYFRALWALSGIAGTFVTLLDNIFQIFIVVKDFFPALGTAASIYPTDR